MVRKSEEDINVALLQIYRLYLLYYTTVIEKLLFYHHQIKRTIFQRPSLKIAMETFGSIIASSFLSHLLGFGKRHQQ